MTTAQPKAGMRKGGCSSSPGFVDGEQDTPRADTQGQPLPHLHETPLVPLKGAHDRPAVFVQCWIVKVVIYWLLNLLGNLSKTSTLLDLAFKNILSCSFNSYYSFQSNKPEKVICNICDEKHVMLKHLQGLQESWRRILCKGT